MSDWHFIGNVIIFAYLVFICGLLGGSLFSYRARKELERRHRENE